MAINFNDPEVTNRAETKLEQNLQVSTMFKSFGIEPATKLTGIELRMLPPLVKDNRTPRIFPFPGFANLYCLTIVVSDVNNQLAGVIDLKGFQRIGDNEHLPINKTLYYWQQKNDNEIAPNQIHIHCTVIKSKESLRDVGEILASLKTNNEYKELTEQLKNLATATTPAGAVIDIVTSVAGVVGNLLGKVEDKPLGTAVRSFTSLRGEFDLIGITPVKIETRNVDFNFEVVVRDPNREKALFSAMKNEGRELPKDSDIEHILSSVHVADIKEKFQENSALLIV